MNSEERKKECAREALTYIRSNSIIGLGGGSTISCLIDLIKTAEDLHVQIVTPSSKTKMQCLRSGLEVLHTSSVDQITVAFDGC